MPKATIPTNPSTQAQAKACKIIAAMESRVMRILNKIFITDYSLSLGKCIGKTAHDARMAVHSAVHINPKGIMLPFHS